MGAPACRRSSGHLSRKKLKTILDRFYRQYDFAARLEHDPIELPHRYRRRGDIEISAFLAAAFAYGRVSLFKPVVERILSIMGRSPHDFLLHADLAGEAGRFAGIRYRFNRNEDILCLLLMVQQILRTEGSLEEAFMKQYNPGDCDIASALAGLVSSFLAVDTSSVYGRNLKPAGLMQFLPSPLQGSTCKRLCLYVRWMARRKDIDFGLWKGVDPARLVIPLDTHIMKISRCLGLTSRKSSDWKTASEITDALRGFDPEDPLKYDFALCHHGISGICKGERDEAGCKGCAFRIC